ncbi:hypothetical protein K440DRAFT_643626 [Wilcoxina mikolae CBS 423.85]|nr:hypothetical protein K440DRAFT_643626 [Wilcoxina mikolae CBS 423.85]
MAFRKNARELNGLRGKNINSSPDAAPFSIINTHRICTQINRDVGTYKDSCRYRRKTRFGNCPIPSFKNDEKQDPNKPEDLPEHVLEIYGNRHDGLFDLNKGDPEKVQLNKVPRTPLADITHLINTPDNVNSSARSDETRDLSLEALDERYSDSVDLSIDMSMRITPRKRPSTPPFTDSEEHPFKPSHIQASSIGCYNMGSQWDQHSKQRETPNCTEGNSTVYDILGSSTEAEEEDRDGIIDVSDFTFQVGEFGILGH